jgi:hypothetical protein
VTVKVGHLAIPVFVGMTLGAVSEHMKPSDNIWHILFVYGLITVTIGLLAWALEGNTGDDE